MNWLPKLICLNDYGGNWERYLEILYTYFKKNFIENKPLFRGKKVNIKRYPLSMGKEATFWHIISEGKDEENRLPDLRRCERICWPRAIIENSEHSNIKFWKNIRKGEKRICLWLENREYLVVLAERTGYVLLWTAYMVTESHRKKKLQKEYENYHSIKS